MKTNYHTHTTRCNHAVGTDKSFIQNAIIGGYDILGFSDHTPWPFMGGYQSPIRMRMDELDGYVGSIRSLAEQFKDEIEIKVGLECEFYIDHIEWLKEQRERLELDFLIFGNHYPWRETRFQYFGNTSTKEMLELYRETSIKAMESRIFDCFAHPELFMRNYPKVDDHVTGTFKDLAEAAKSLDVAFERNIAMRFNPQLWEIVADIAPKVIIGIDAHNRKILKDPKVYEDGEAEIAALGITPIKKL